MDIENVLIGVPCLYRSHLLHLRRTTTAEGIDVYCFGRTLYEMAFGTTLQDYYCDIYPDGINEDLGECRTSFLMKILLLAFKSRY